MNEEQIELWNGAAGDAWVDAQEILDDMFRPFEHRLVAAAARAGATRVLDVGCGTGATTLAIARRLGPAATCTGVDVSRPMIELARQRATRERSSASFLVADAAAHGFDSAAYDLIVSRFGVMFFEDPVRAFANLRRATSSDGALRCMVFRSPAENPFMTAAERAAAPLLPQLPPRRADGPGQFAFADADKVRRIIEDAGWSSVTLEPIDVECAIPETQLKPYLMRLGPVGFALRSGVDEATREQVIRAVRAGFAPYIEGDQVRFTAACWELSARA